jgi:mannosyltransferase
MPTPRRPPPTPDDPGDDVAVPGLSPRGLVLALTALAAALRFSGLGRQSFWYDEAVSVALARHPVADLLTGRIRDQGNPPLYPVLLHGWMALFGDSDATVRGLSALFGAATIPVMLAVARKIVPQHVALLGATLLALAPFHLQMAQEARGYTLMALLATTAALALLLATERASEDAPAALQRWAPWGLLALATAAMALTHYFGLLLALAQMIYVGIVHRRHRPVLVRAAAAYATAALLFAFWLPALGQQLGQPGNLARSTESWALHLVATPLVFTVGTALLWKDVAAEGAPVITVILRVLAGTLGTLAALAAAGLGFWRTWQRTRQDRNRGTLLLITWLAVPIALPALISLGGHPVYNARYAIAASLPFLLFVAAGLYELGDRPRVVLGGILVVAMGAATFANLSWLGPVRPLKHQWREAAAFVEAVRRPEDLILFDADHNETAYAHYAGPSRARGGQPERLRVMPPPPGAPAGHLFAAAHADDPSADVTAAVNAHDRVWMILSDPAPRAVARAHDFFATWTPGPATRLRGIAIQLYQHAPRGLPTDR